MGRPLDPDEERLWSRVRATARPLPGRSAAPVLKPAPADGPAAPVREKRTKAASARPSLAPAAPPPVAPPRGPGITLDRAWDRRLAGGIVAPDSTIDLHGHTLSSAHAYLDHGLDRAIRRGDRVVLLVTGRPPRPESERPHARGAIRASIADWLGLSRHAGAIAAVRGAHPRHGGQGALYVVLRRPREGR